jgi:peroxiredoxin
MSANNYKCPFFDLSEIIPDNDLVYKVYQPLKPVKTGNFVPQFTLTTDYDRWQRFNNGTVAHGPVMLRQLLNKPLVISFFSKHWQTTGIEQLARLNALQTEIKANGGNLLIINAENDDVLAKLAWEKGLSLNFYYDKDNEIAEMLRVFSENDPLWNKFSGIDANAPLLATFVIDIAKQIVYDHIDLDLKGTFSPDQIISAVYESALIRSNKKSA